MLILCAVQLSFYLHLIAGNVADLGDPGFQLFNQNNEDNPVRRPCEHTTSCDIIDKLDYKFDGLERRVRSLEQPSKSLLLSLLSFK